MQMNATTSSNVLGLQMLDGVSSYVRTVNVRTSRKTKTAKSQFVPEWIDTRKDMLGVVGSQV